MAVQSTHECLDVWNICSNEINRRTNTRIYEMSEWCYPTSRRCRRSTCRCVCHRFLASFAVYLVCLRTTSYLYHHTHVFGLFLDSCCPSASSLLVAMVHIFVVPYTTVSSLTLFLLFLLLFRLLSGNCSWMQQTHTLVPHMHIILDVNRHKIPTFRIF